MQKKKIIPNALWGIGPQSLVKMDDKAKKAYASYSLYCKNLGIRPAKPFKWYWEVWMK